MMPRAPRRTCANEPRATKSLATAPKSEPRARSRYDSAVRDRATARQPNADRSESTSQLAGESQRRQHDAADETDAREDDAENPEHHSAREWARKHESGLRHVASLRNAGDDEPITPRARNLERSY